MRTSILILASLVCSISGLQAKAAPRCGWLENPSTANNWLTDRDGRWILSTQGVEFPKGLDNMPDMTTHDFVTTYASHGYACACVEAKFDANKTATEIFSARQLPLSRCRHDRSLPKPSSID